MYVCRYHPILPCADSPQNAPVCHVREAQNGILTHFSSFSLLLSLKYETWSISAKSVPRAPSSSSANTALRYPASFGFFRPEALLTLWQETFIHFFSFFFNEPPLPSFYPFLPFDAGLDLFLQRLFLKLFFFSPAKCMWILKYQKLLFFSHFHREKASLRLAFLTGMRVVMSANWAPNKRDQQASPASFLLSVSHLFNHITVSGM